MLLKDSKLSEIEEDGTLATKIATRSVPPHLALAIPGFVSFRSCPLWANLPPEPDTDVRG